MEGGQNRVAIIRNGSLISRLGKIYLRVDAATVESLLCEHEPVALGADAIGNRNPAIAQEDLGVTTGAEVTGVDNSGKLDFMRSLGADHVIDYTREDFTTQGKQYDRILDLIAEFKLVEDGARGDRESVDVGNQVRRNVLAVPQ